MNILTKLANVISFSSALIVFFITFNLVNFALSYTMDIPLKDILGNGWVIFSVVLSVINAFLIGMNLDDFLTALPYENKDK